MPAPDEAVLARREQIVAALRAIPIFSITRSDG